MNQQLKQIVIGKAFFKENTSKQLIKAEELSQTLNKDSWIILKQDYQNLNWKRVFFNMDSCSNEYLQLKKLKNSQILKEINHIVFANLKNLILGQSNISNLQPLSWISLENLQHLNLINNHIIQIKCFSKMYLPSLDTPVLNKNPIIQINPLTRFKSNKQKLKILFLQLYKYVQVSNQLYIPIINEDLSIIVKLGFESIGQIWSKSYERIKQSKIEDILHLRFQKMFINPW